MATAHARCKEDESGEEGGHSGSADINIDCEWAKGHRQVLDLERLAFLHGDLLKPNKKCYPDGYDKLRHKGYTEVHVPDLKPKPLDPGEELVRISSLPDWAQPAFKGITWLNRVQSKIYQEAFHKQHNILLCAPTGAGKTNAALLTILHQIGMNRNGDGSINHKNYKIVYVAPMKALVPEVVGNLSKRLQHYGVQVRGYSETLLKQEIEETQIIVTTPDLFDGTTRLRGSWAHTQPVKLLVIDQIHGLHENGGAALEGIVARFQYIANTKRHIRFVGLSATLANCEDIALFLKVDLKEGLFKFDNSFRVVPLAQQYVGIAVEKPFQRFQLMNDLCYEKVIRVAGKHQVLLFCHMNKETAETARAVRDTALAKDTLAKFLKEDSVSREILQRHSELVQNNDLKDLLPYGFAIHHAGLVRADRQIVEELFGDGHVQVLVATAALAWGVNLHANTVIIKDTKVYNPEKSAWTQLGPLDVMQMLGRAGRPQFDTSGVGIIITGLRELRYYVSLMNHQLPVESQYISKLADQLNAAIVLGTVQNAREACNWLTYSYLHRCMIRNGTRYGISREAREEDPAWEKLRADLIHSAAKLLAKHKLVIYDPKRGYFQFTDLGCIASYYDINHGSLATYTEHLKPNMGDIELCRLFSLSEEFKYVTVRKHEKTELAELLARVPISVKESLKEPRAKVNVLLQAYISKFEPEGWSLMSDMGFITQSVGRLMRALFQIVMEKKYAQLASKVLKWCNMFDSRMWDSQTPDLITNKVSMEQNNFPRDRHYDLFIEDKRQLHPVLEHLFHKNQYPELELKVLAYPITRFVLKVVLTITPDVLWGGKVQDLVEPFWVIVEDNDDDRILHHEFFLLKKQNIDEDHKLIFTVPMKEQVSPQYFIRVVSHRWIDSHTVISVPFSDLTQQEKYPPLIRLLKPEFDFVTALKNPLYGATLYKNSCKVYPPVQAHLFTTLYNSDHNMLLAAPIAYNEKTVCAELAILRNYEKVSDTPMLAVYIAPKESIANRLYKDWKRRFGDELNMTVYKLTGKTATDLKHLEKGQIIISTPEIWDALSRRWKELKYVQQVSLFIVDEIHLISGLGGHVMEVIVSRMRNIASQVKHTIRIVAFSTSIANANDLGEWIGTTSQYVFSFPPCIRAVPLHIQVKAFDIANFEARVHAMTWHAYAAISKCARAEKTTIVFVPTPKHAFISAMTFMSFNSGDTNNFLLCSKEKILEQLKGGVDDSRLRMTLEKGIGYLHEELSSSDQILVKRLLAFRYISVCVMNSSFCWDVPSTENLVVVMGTQCYERKEYAETDYPMTELLHMVGHVSRRLVDDVGLCIILCHAPHKHYYEKILNQAFLVESYLHHYIYDIMNAEVSAGVIDSKQAAVEYLKRTFMYRRLTKNPYYYNLQGDVSEYLSNIVEKTLAVLEANQCVAIEDDGLVSPTLLGMIAFKYNISYKTIGRFNSSLTPETRLGDLLQIICSASEYDLLRVCPGEIEEISKLASHQMFFFKKGKYIDPHMKANSLLQAHFSRDTVSASLEYQQKNIILIADRLVQALVDIITIKGWLKLGLAVIDLGYMLRQGIWKKDSPLLQVPHFTKARTVRCKYRSWPGGSIDNISDFLDMDLNERLDLLHEMGMSDNQVLDVVDFSYCFPGNVDFSYQVVDGVDAQAEGNARLEVTLEQNERLNRWGSWLDEAMLRVARVGTHSPGPPLLLRKAGWWVVIGDIEEDILFDIKWITFHDSSIVQLMLDFPPAAPKLKYFDIFLLSDSYSGFSKMQKFLPQVSPGVSSSHLSSLR